MELELKKSPRREVHKFGGTSVGSAERIEAAAKILFDRRSEATLLAVTFGDVWRH